MGRQQQSFYPFSGGLDLETPAIAMPPGRLIAALNYEGAAGGYKRAAGYERFDGQPSPSSLTFFFAAFINGELEIEPGDTIEGLASGATATIYHVIVNSGSWGAGDAAGTLAMATPSDDFNPGEILEVGGNPAAEIVDVPLLGDRHSGPLEMELYLEITGDRRAAISEVPGEGPVRGVVWIDDTLHAWRDNIGATACVGHRATSSGWEAHNYGQVLKFDASVDEIFAGNTITGATSGATATVRRAAKIHNNNWTGAAAGVLILDGVAGTFQDNENIQVGGVTKAVANGVVSAVTFPPGGRYRFKRENFYGSTGTERAYGVTGVSQAFDFDGESVIFIPTGMVDDRPFLIATHKKHLFLGFPKGSLQLSSLGEPLLFNAITGAAEIGLGDELTNLVPNSADTLLVTTARSIAILNGNDVTDFALQVLSRETGARANSAAWIGDVLYQDERGIRSVSASQRYGNFTVGTFTQLVQKELTRKRNRGINPVEAFAAKERDSYNLFFDDGSALSLYIGRKSPEAMPLKYPYIPTCFWSEEVDGRERIFAGAADGFVYETNVGPSFDGEPLNAFMQFPFAHQGGPRVMKRYHKAMFELDAPIGSTINVFAQFDYGAGLQPFTESDIFSLNAGGGGTWDISNWDEFYWDSPIVGRIEAHLQGVGENMSLTVASESAVMDTHTFQGVTLAYSVRGQFR